MLIEKTGPSNPFGAKTLILPVFSERRERREGSGPRLLGRQAGEIRGLEGDALAPGIGIEGKGQKLGHGLADIDRVALQGLG